MLTLRGNKYAKDAAEMRQDETCAGYYRVKSNAWDIHGVLLMDREKIPFAFAVRRGLDSWFVTAGRDATGRIRYMFCTDAIVERKLGIEGLSFSQQRQAAAELINGALHSMGK